MADFPSAGPLGGASPIGAGGEAAAMPGSGAATGSAVTSVAQDALAHLSHTLENMPNKLADGISKMEHQEAAGAEDMLNLNIIQMEPPKELEEIEPPLIDETEEAEEEGDEGDRKEEGGDGDREDKQEGDEVPERYDPVDMDPDKIDVKKPDPF